MATTCFTIWNDPPAPLAENPKGNRDLLSCFFPGQILGNLAALFFKAKTFF